MPFGGGGGSPEPEGAEKGALPLGGGTEKEPVGSGKEAESEGSCRAKRVDVGSNGRSVGTPPVGSRVNVPVGIGKSPVSVPEGTPVGEPPF